MSDESEEQWLIGNRAAWLEILRTCLRHLGVENPEKGHARWVVEREEAVARLRDVCEDYGDNDWDSSLHLADVIEKHIAWGRFDDNGSIDDLGEDA